MAKVAKIGFVIWAADPVAAENFVSEFLSLPHGVLSRVEVIVGGEKLLSSVFSTRDVPLSFVAHRVGAAVADALEEFAADFMAFRFVCKGADGKDLSLVNKLGWISPVEMMAYKKGALVKMFDSGEIALH